MTKLEKNIDAKMKDAFELLLKKYGKIRTGRANTSSLDDIKIDYYGNQLSLNNFPMSQFRNRVSS